MISVINQTCIDSYFTSFEPSTLCCCCFKKLLNGSRGASGADPSPGAQPNPARLGVAGAYSAPPGGPQESTQPNREVKVTQGPSFRGPMCSPPLPLLPWWSWTASLRRSSWSRAVQSTLIHLLSPATPRCRAQSMDSMSLAANSSKPHSWGRYTHFMHWKT